MELVAVHHPYPAVSLPDGIKLELGDLYAREPRQRLVEFMVPDPIAATKAKIATVAVAAHVRTEDGGVEGQEVTFTVAHPLSRMGRQEPEVRKERVLLGAAKAREQALEAQARGDYDTARRVLRDATDNLADLGLWCLHRRRCRRPGGMVDRLQPGVFLPRDAKYLFQRAYDAQRGRRSAGARISRVKRVDEKA